MHQGTQGSFANPEKIVTHFHLKEGDFVADFGAGSGGYMKALSEAVGESGRVYLCDIQKPLVEALGNRAMELHLKNVRTLWSDIEHEGGVKLEDNKLDAVLLPNVLFQFENKEMAVAQVQRVLRQGGRVFIIDWSDSFGGLGPRSEDIIAEDVARKFFEQSGFSYVTEFPAGDHHYGMILRKA